MDACTVLLREEGLMDAKEMVRNDASILRAAADRALKVREADAAERAQRLAELAAEEVGEELPSGWGPQGGAAAAPAYSYSAPAKAAPKATGPIADVLDAIQRSPISLELTANSKGVSALAGMPDDLIVDSISVLVREEGWFGAKTMVAENAEVIKAASKRALVRCRSCMGPAWSLHGTCMAVLPALSCCMLPC